MDSTEEFKVEETTEKLLLMWLRLLPQEERKGVMARIRRTFCEACGAALHPGIRPCGCGVQRHSPQLPLSPERREGGGQKA